MRMYSTLFAGAMGLALVAGTPFSSQAQDVKSWGPKHTTYWSSEATGKHDPGKFMEQGQPMAQPAATQVRPQMRQQRMYYQAPAKRTRAQMRVRQQQPGMRPGQPPADQGMQPPPAERGAPSAPPAGQAPAQGTPK